MSYVSEAAFHMKWSSRTVTKSKMGYLEIGLGIGYHKEISDKCF